MSVQQISRYSCTIRQEVKGSLYAEGIEAGRALPRLRWSWLTTGNPGECSIA